MPDSNSDTKVGPGDVARMFGVTVSTVRQWERAGKIPKSFRTPGNQRRWLRSDLESLEGRAS